MSKFFIKSLFVLAFTAFLILVLWAVLLNSFPLIVVEKETLASHRVPGKEFTIEITRIATGATSADVVQVTKAYANGKSEILKNVDDFTELGSSELTADSVLRLIVISNNKIDTVEVAIK